jgi:mono/diheme cytochrome c family protein
VIVATLALVWSGLSNPGLAQQPTATDTTSPPAAPEASTDDIDGQQMFLNICGFCHEDGGRSAGRGPKLANTARSDDFIINRIKTGKPGSMPAFGSVFSDGQIIAILAYIRGLDG